MPKLSQSSALKLSTCHPALIDLFETVAEHFDCLIIEGHRGEAAQNAAFARGASRLKFPHGKHNASPSMAVDAAPLPLDWGDKGTPEQRAIARIRFYHFAGFVQGVAAGKGIRIRYGGDWDRDNDLADNRFADLVHFELLPDDGPELARPEQIA